MHFRASSIVKEKLRALRTRASHLPQHVRLASTLKFASRFLAGSPEPSHRDFISLSGPPALTVPQCAEKHVLVVV